MCARRRPWWLLILLLLAGGAVWAARLLRDDEGWTADDEGEWTPSFADAAVAAPADESAATTVAEPAAATPVPVPDAPAALRADARDDLTRLEGVGPKIAAALAASGLSTFAALADASEDELRDALRSAALRSAASLPTWSRQARLLADGDEAGFRALTDRLVGGREV